MMAESYLVFGKCDVHVVVEAVIKHVDRLVP